MNISMKHPFIPILIAAGTLLFSGCAHKEVCLLGGHLTMTLPAGAELADGASDEETLYIIGKNEQKIHVRAMEMIRFAGPDFVAASTKDMEEYRRRPEYKNHEIGTLGDDIVYLLITRPPAQEYADSDTFRYGMADVRGADGMVQHIMFYFGSDHAKDIPACRKFMLAALGSIKDGKAPDLRARTVDVTDMGGQKMKLTLPEGYYQTDLEGPDFDVHRFREVRKPGSVGSSIMLYLGCFPSSMEDHVTGIRKGTLLGREVDWKLGRNASFLVADGIIPLDLQYFLHVRINAGSKEKLETLISAAESMTLTGKRGVVKEEKPNGAL